MEFTLLLAALTGVGAAWVVARRSPGLFDTILGAAIVGLGVGRLAAMVSNGTNPLTHLSDILFVRGGVHTGFAAMAALAFVLWKGRPSPSSLADSVSTPALVGLAGWHGGCLWRDGCIGTATDLPWAMSLPGSEIGRHPVELYAALGFVAAALFVAWLLRRDSPPWLAAGIAIGLASGIRLATQPLRASITGGPVGWYVAGLVVGAALVSAAYWSRSRAPAASPG